MRRRRAQSGAGGSDPTAEWGRQQAVGKVGKGTGGSPESPQHPPGSGGRGECAPTATHPGAGEHRVPGAVCGEAKPRPVVLSPPTGSIPARCGSSGLALPFPKGLGHFGAQLKDLVTPPWRLVPSGGTRGAGVSVPRAAPACEGPAWGHGPSVGTQPLWSGRGAGFGTEVAGMLPRGWEGTRPWLAQPRGDQAGATHGVCLCRSRRRGAAGTGGRVSGGRC